MRKDDFTPREQAKLEDFVKKDLGRPQDTGPSVQREGLSAQHDLKTDIKKQRSESTKKLSSLTPSLSKEQEELPPVLGRSEDELDVDLFARGDVSKVVDELKQNKAEEQQKLLAKKAGLAFVHILGYPISPDVLALVPYELAKSAGVVAYLRAGKKVRLGVLDPTKQATAKAMAELKRQTSYDFLEAVIGEDSYRYAMKLYEQLPKPRREADDVAISAGGKRQFESDIKSFVDLKSKIKDVPTTKLVDTLLTGAVKVGASDIHIEPTEHATRVRYRLDGVLQTVAEFPPEVTNAIMSRLKFLAKLKLDVNRLPQDGRFTIKDESSGRGKDGQVNEIDVRVATIPAEFGETVTMRLLDRQTLALSINSLGLTGLALKKVLGALKKPQGMVLECGPTGSGKTTTLYAFLSRINDPGKKVITLEDPVEYRLPGIVQSQVQPEHGYDFGEGFRSVLRLDPDIVMIGEIRDDTTAEMATQASLTGHIVLSTLHTNDAPTALPRLIDLGVRPFLLSHAISVVIAQRLVRKVCPHCAEERHPDAVELAEVKRRLGAVPPQAKESVPPEQVWLFMEGRGCEQCNGTGFHGRIGIFEVLIPDETMEKLAIAQAPVSQLKQEATKAGMMTMEQDGLVKAVTGVTTIDEIWRVARDI